MQLQNFEQKNKKIKDAFLELKQNHPEKFSKRLKFSWSNWGFGLESLETSAKRLEKAGIRYIELHGNHYGADLGYKPKETLDILNSCGIQVGGVCGMFSYLNDMSSNNPIQRQAAIDYLKRELAFCEEVGAEYILVVPGAVGRNAKYDDSEYERSVETLRIVADLFVKHGVKGAVEPIRSAEVSLIHTFEDAKRYIRDVDRPGIRHINGDVYHMQSEESHIGEAIVNAKDYLINLHMADSNRCALGLGSMDIDTIIMALYLIDYQGYVTPEPLGPGGDPYPAQNGKTAPEILDALVNQSATYFREREEAVLAL